MELHTHLVDFGMVVLLWLVQLVIYPSFLNIDTRQLVAWHRVYTFRVAFVIVPMLFSQLILWIYRAIIDASFISIIGLILVFICWILTFFVSVPLHRKIERGEGSDTILKRLIATNWPRTICWTAVFIVGILG